MVLAGGYVDMTLEQIGKRIRKKRKEKKWTQQKLAEKSGLSVPFISNVERGTQEMGILSLIAISNALDVSVDWILRNNTSEAALMVDDEIRKELEGCTARERELILDNVKNMKAGFTILKEESREDRYKT